MRQPRRIPRPASLARPSRRRDRALRRWVIRRIDRSAGGGEDVPHQLARAVSGSRCAVGSSRTSTVRRRAARGRARAAGAVRREARTLLRRRACRARAAATPPSRPGVPAAAPPRARRRRAGAREEKILANRRVEDVGLLAGERERSSDVLLPHLPHVTAADRDPAGLGVEEAEEEVGDGGLAGAALADERDPATGREPRSKPSSTARPAGYRTVTVSRATVGAVPRRRGGSLRIDDRPGRSISSSTRRPAASVAVSSCAAAGSVATLSNDASARSATVADEHAVERPAACAATAAASTPTVVRPAIEHDQPGAESGDGGVAAGVPRRACGRPRGSRRAALLARRRARARARPGGARRARPSARRAPAPRPLPSTGRALGRVAARRRPRSGGPTARMSPARGRITAASRPTTAQRRRARRRAGRSHADRGPAARRRRRPSG